jgi:hypothetical protein
LCIPSGKSPLDIFQKLLRKLADRRVTIQSCFSVAFRKELVMFSKLEKNKLPLNIKLFNIRWYPSNRSCVNKANQKAKPQQMPPLMVRKPEWRR